MNTKPSKIMYRPYKCCSSWTAQPPKMRVCRDVDKSISWCGGEKQVRQKVTECFVVVVVCLFVCLCVCVCVCGWMGGGGRLTRSKYKKQQQLMTLYRSIYRVYTSTPPPLPTSTCSAFIFISKWEINRVHTLDRKCYQRANSGASVFTKLMKIREN